MPMQARVTGLAEAQSPPVTGPQFDNRRLAAALVDVLLLVPVALAIKTLCGGWGATAAALTSGWALYYYFAFESGTGQTIGKRLLGIRVVRKDGGTPTMGEIGVRTALRVVDGLFAYVVGLVVMLVTGERRQRLGDIVAGTVVTAASAAPPAEPPVEADEPVLHDVPDPTTPLPGLEPYTEDELPEAEPFPPAAEAPEQEITLPDFDDLAPAEPEPEPDPGPELPIFEPVDEEELPPLDSAVPPPAFDPPDVELPSLDSAVPPPAFDPVVEPAPSPFADEPVPVAEPEEDDAPRMELPPPASAIDLLMNDVEADQAPGDDQRS